MKKIININMSGRVIPIEDAAYERLQRYIESLRRYFAAEEGRDEIINDIESRVAELMNDKVKKGAAAVTEEDMEGIINTMGRVEDFEEADASDAGTASAAASAASASASTAAEESPFTRITGRRPRGRLYRNSNERMIGGVCSGLANYFEIDPAIVRILFVLLAFGGFSFIAYLVLWVFVPKRVLPPVVTKRFFRNPEDRVIGGVAGGIAAYFKWDAWIVRLVFLAPVLLKILVWLIRVLSPFSGHGFVPDVLFGSFGFTLFLTYVVLWIILPMAYSPFEKMEMRGENVDVQRIRDNVKTQAQAFAEEVKTSAQDLGARASEFANTRGRAFAAEVSQAARPMASTAGEIIVAILKAIVVAFAGIMALAFFGVLTALLFTGIGDMLNNFILEGQTQKVLGWGGLLLLFGVPFLALITWIIRRVMNVRTGKSYLGWAFGGLWILGLLMSIGFAGSMFNSFRYSGMVSENIEAPTVRDRMIVRVTQPPVEYGGYYSFFHPDDRTGFDINNDSLTLSNVRVQVEKSIDSQYHVVVEKRSLGGNRALAQERAQRLTYLTQVQDSFLNLGSGYSVNRAQKWRDQHIVVRIQVPVGKKLRFEPSLRERLNVTQRHIDVHGDRRWRRDWDTDWDDDFSSTDSWKSNVDYVMSPEGELVDPMAPVAPTTTDPDSDPNGVYEYRRNDTPQRSHPVNNKRSNEGPDAPEQPEQPEQREAPEARVNYTPVPMLSTFSLVAS